jgi:hypothetical protein
LACAFPVLFGVFGARQVRLAAAINPKPEEAIISSESTTLHLHLQN